MQYTFSLSRRSLPVRCLCLLLVVLVLWCFFMIPRASAVVLEGAAVYYAGAFIGTVLVAAGYTFANAKSMADVGNSMYKSIVSAGGWAANKISALATWAVQNGKAIGGKAVRVGQDLYQAIVDAFNATYADGVYSGAGLDGTPQSFDNWSDAYAYIATLPLGASIHLYCDSYDSNYGKYVPYHFYTRPYFSGSSFELDRGYALSGTSMTVTTSHNALSGTVYSSYLYASSTYGGIGVSLGVKIMYTNGKSTGFTFSPFSGCSYTSLSMPVVVSTAEGVYYPVGANDVAYPSDSSLVKMPDLPTVSSVTGAVNYPADMPYTKDAVSVPYPVDSEGVQVPDIPYDTVVDQSTGKTVDDTDTGTDTDNPGTDAGTDTGASTGILQKILDLLKNFFDSPSDFKLDMDGFRNLAIKDKFPFCIPFDMVDSVKQFAATAADYEFRINLQTQYFSVNHVVDLTPLAVPLAFFRYIVVTWFVWVLLSRTRDLMKW